MILIEQKTNIDLGLRQGLLRAKFQMPVTLPVEVARHLREAIIGGEIRPGERLNELKLTHAFGLSRAPIREGLRILQAEGLINIEPRRGAFVRTLSPDGLREIFDTRLMFESYAISRGKMTLTDARLQSMSQMLTDARIALQKKNYEPWHQASLRFHDAIIGLADNDYLRTMYERIKTSVRSYQIMLVRLPGQPTRSQADHESILESLTRRDIPQALDRLREHFDDLESTIRENIP
jgi:DNA-binding GntR family transcriptional regulator